MINDIGIDHGMIGELRELGGDALVAEIVSTYVQESAGDLIALARSIADDDPAALDRAAHRLKSASATLGAATVAGYAEELCYLGRSGSTVGGDALLTLLQAAWDLAVVELTPLQDAA